MICVICFEEQDVLKIVGECKHKFCFSCLLGHLEQHCDQLTFPCPSCQAECFLPWDELDGLADFTGEEDDLYFDCTTDGEPSEEGGTVREPSEEGGAVPELGEVCGAVKELDVESGSVSELGEVCDAVKELDVESGSVSELGEVCDAVKELDVVSDAERNLDEECGAVDRSMSEKSGTLPELDQACDAVKGPNVDIGAVVEPDAECGEVCGAMNEHDVESGAEKNLDKECGAVDRSMSEKSGTSPELGETCDAVDRSLSDDSCAVKELGETCDAVQEPNVDSGAVVKPDADSGAVRELDENCCARVELGAECGELGAECGELGAESGAVREVESAEPVTDLTCLFQKNCQICRHVNKTVQAANLCPECDQLYLCQKCTRLHGSNPATKMHVVVQLKEDSMCCEHKAPLTSYCCSCNKTACKICVMMSHGHHCVEKISNLIQWKVEEVKVALRGREEDLERLQCQLAQLVALKVDSQVLDQQDSLIKEIESHAENCVDEIIAWKEILKAQVKRDFKVIKEIPKVLKDVSDSVKNLQWGVSVVSEKLSKVDHRASYLDTLTSMNCDLNMMQTVSQAHDGVVTSLLCGLYQTPDCFVPSQVPLSIGQLFRSANSISKVALPVFVPMEQTVDPSGRLGTMSSWASVPTVLTTPSNNYAVDRVKQVVFRLTVVPGNLEEFMIPLVGDLNTTPVDQNTVIDIINVIFEQAIAESNFTYTGARMCDWFVREYKPLTDGQPIKFLSLLMKRCQLEQENSLVLAQENPPRLQGFTLFMAELFQNVKVVVPGGEERIEVLGKKLKELVRILLQHPSDSNLKCVVRILKCTGAVLEDTERSQNQGPAPDMDNLISLCAQQAMSPACNTSESARAMLMKVADIRSTNWGRMESVPVQVVAPPQQRAPSPFTQSDPVFFDPSGRMITREEAGFAEGEQEYSFGDEYQEEWSAQDLQFQEQDYEYDPSFDDNGYLDTEIDAEIALAFEQFLIETQQA